MKKHIIAILFIFLLLTGAPVSAEMSKNAQQLYQQACKLELQNNIEGAVKLIVKAIDISGEDAILYTKLAGLYADLGDYRSALGAYKKAIKLRPNDAFIYISIGNILQNTGDYENAYNSYMQAMEIFPSYKYNYLNIANVLLAQKKYDKAIEYYNLFIAAYPNVPSSKENLATAYLNTGKYALAVKNYSEAYKADATKFSEYANYGFALFEEKQYAQAVDILKLALADNLDNLKVRADLAVSYHYIGKYELSKQQFEQIFKIKPDLTSLRIYYANLLSDMQLYDDAVKEYTTYLKAYPNDADAYKLLALVYKNQGNDELAVQNLLASLAKNNKDLEVKKELAYQYHKKNDYNNALKYYNEILKESPDNYDIKANKALALHALKKYDEAIAIYEELLASKKNDRLSKNLVSAYISKGDYLLTKSKYKESIEPFERAVMLDANQSYAYYGLAKAYELTGNNDLAIVNYEKALEIEPDKELYKKDYKAFSDSLNVAQNAVVSSNNTSVSSENSTKKEVVVEEKTIATPAKPVAASDFNNNNELANIDNLMIQKKTEQIDDKVKTLIKEGDDLYKSGKNTEAIIKYIEVLKLSPNDSLTSFKTANLYKIENNPDKAIVYYKKAVSINKNYSDAWFNLGLTYVTKNDFKSSRDCFNKVISLSPDYAYAYYAIALSYEKESAYDKAIEYYEKYYNLETDDLTKQAIKNKISELKNLKSK